MKSNLILASLVIGLISFSCNKKEGGNKGIISESQTTETTVTDHNGKIDSISTSSTEHVDNGGKKTSESLSYKALDGSRAKATFSNDNGKKTLMIEANNNKFQLDFVNKTPHGEHYMRNQVSADTKGDSLIIKQDDIIIPLVLDK